MVYCTTGVLLTIARKRGNSVKFTGEEVARPVKFTGERRGAVKFTGEGAAAGEGFR